MDLHKIHHDRCEIQFTGRISQMADLNDDLQMMIIEQNDLRLSSFTHLKYEEEIEKFCSYSWNRLTCM